MRRLLRSALRGALGRRHDPVAGVGVDIEEVARWRGELRWAALFSADELERCRELADPPRQLAGLWCAKEAVFKAVSGELAVTLRDITIGHRSDGAPVVAIAGHEEASARVILSITHSRNWAAAVAILQRRFPT